MSRAGPNASRAVAAYGRRSATVQDAQSASVTIPDSLANTLGAAASSPSRVAQGSRAPAAIGGLDRWSSTKLGLRHLADRLDRGRELARAG